MMASPVLDWTFVMPESRWEVAWLHCNEINHEGLIQRVPEPIDWQLMGPSNLQRTYHNEHALFVELPQALGYFKFNFLNEQFGIKVFKHCSDKRPYVLLVRLVPPTQVVNVRCKTAGGGFEVICSCALSGVYMQTQWYDLDRKVTVADLRTDVKHEMTMSQGMSIHTMVKFMRAGGTTPLHPNTLLWSTTWLERREPNPRRRVFGKQSKMVQSRLDKFFNYA
jgi:hypothetical protein